LLSWVVAFPVPFPALALQPKGASPGGNGKEALPPLGWFFSLPKGREASDNPGKRESFSTARKSNQREGEGEGEGKRRE
jgi:hypothetical protein